MISLARRLVRWRFSAVNTVARRRASHRPSHATRVSPRVTVGPRRRFLAWSLGSRLLGSPILPILVLGRPAPRAAITVKPCRSRLLARSLGSRLLGSSATSSRLVPHLERACLEVLRFWVVGRAHATVHLAFSPPCPPPAVDRDGRLLWSTALCMMGGRLGFLACKPVSLTASTTRTDRPPGVGVASATPHPLSVL